MSVLVLRIKRVILALLAMAALLFLGFQVLIYTTLGQDFLLEQAAKRLASRPMASEDGLRVFVCGSSSPLPSPDRAQACIAILTPEQFLIVDVGSGSANVLGVERLPLERLDGVLLTHFHSDHIVDLPSVNVQAWAAGRGAPLTVYGPPGVGNVIEGYNLALSYDRQYRSAHHGHAFMPIEDGLMEPAEFPAGSTVNFGALSVTAFTADHSPIEPAVSYRFDYKGRSVIVTGDTIVTHELHRQVQGVDLLLTDALSVPILETLRSSMNTLGRVRLAKILLDIQDYHANMADVIELARSSDLGKVGLYHLVPAPRNAVMEQVFLRGVPDNVILTREGMWFELPVGSKEIIVDPKRR